MANKKATKPQQTRRPVRAVVHAAKMSYADFDARKNEIFSYSQKADQLRRQLLRDCGWVCHNKGTPGGYWMWHKIVDNQVLVADNIDAAMVLQDGLVS